MFVFSNEVLVELIRSNCPVFLKPERDFWEYPDDLITIAQLLVSNASKVIVLMDEDMAPAGEEKKTPREALQVLFEKHLTPLVSTVELPEGRQFMVTLNHL